ncbi:MAG: hypothetical protein HKL80_10395 [Acidimicrobiales bacterium]|nr:hypothetical protein [Acidimicrobiales bacterium]
MPNRSPLSKLVDIAFYAPVGIMKLAADSMDRAVEVGEALVTSKLTVAKAVGKFTSNYGANEIKKRVKELTPYKTELSDQEPESDFVAAVEEIQAESTLGTKASEPIIECLISVDELAIPGYDTLAASQVVQRLVGLSIQDLEAVASYETAHRGRRTVLAKTEQLLSK